MKNWILAALLCCPMWAMAQGNPTPPEGQTPEEWAKVSYYNNTVKFRPLAVLFGDSITNGWPKEDGGWFFERFFVGRGISGQTTAQMLIRFRPHVIELSPKYVVILAGINDIARNTGYMPLELTFANICQMADEARRCGIKPILCTLTPADEIGWRKALGDPSPKIDSLNTMIKDYAARQNLPLADYHSAMLDEKGDMRAELRRDAVHPNKAGYKVMEKVLWDVFIQLGEGEAPAGEKIVLTPKEQPAPEIHGPKVYGARPDRPILFRIPTSGVRPMTFSASGLPKGLKLDARTGIITGKIRKAGDYSVKLQARNEAGTDESQLTFKIGETICLTPPMGWNSWNVWGNTVSQENVLAAAKALVRTGLADYGWSYINIDDGWQGLRGGKYGAIQPNKKFPDMKAMADSIHALGLKVGIYSGPWVTTYAGHIGSSADFEDGAYQFIKDSLYDEVYKLDRTKAKRRHYRYFGPYSFAQADARQWADWGMDYLKYDWYPQDVPHVQEMQEALRATKRDIVYSLSNTAPFADAPSWASMSNCFRTTDDIRDTWPSMKQIGFDWHLRWSAAAGPGHWPDADMLVVGELGWGQHHHPTSLTPDEQYTHISLWSLLSSPLLIGCDLDRLDDFTLGLLKNPEIIAVNQDEAGQMAVLVTQNEQFRLYAKPLSDGSMAVGLFNMSQEELDLGFTPRSLGFVRDVQLRNMWTRSDIGKVDCNYFWHATIPPHGVVMIQVR